MTSVLPTLWFEGEYPLARSGGECASSTASLLINHMPPRTTRKSYRPRVSDRTMVGNLQPHCLSASEVDGRGHANKMNLQKWENHGLLTPSLGLDARKNFLLPPVDGEVFPLTSPFIERANRKLTLYPGVGGYWGPVK